MQTGTIQKWLGLYIIFLSQLHLIISAPRKGNPDELGSEVQGDIKSPLRCRNAPRKGYQDEWGSEVQGDIKIPHRCRNATIKGNAEKLLPYWERSWPDGIVPYMFGDIFAENSKPSCVKRPWKRTTILRITVYNLLKELTKQTMSEKDCWSDIGKKGGLQKINLPQVCIEQFGTVLHELYHCLGFYHEQARHDRDNYVEIMWDNIEKEEKYNFDCYGPDIVGTFGEEYDYMSLMHYAPYDFAIDVEKPTIITKDPKYQDLIGKTQKLSDTDLRKLLKMYNCPNADS
ncbi:Meprin A subunit alpha [Armadillidium nasatum]|uniref:Metalloendopeptidase n=1 Tax=Armadillidium nasatum TaxID=96803 RepID=A0A5N5T4N0_9CRUS|nr:Meprin A subunit alpha [Armadillidium nasatum]